MIADIKLQPIEEWVKEEKSSVKIIDVCKGRKKALV